MSKAILPKNNRNLGDRKAAVIYRRGVRVREFESSDQESLFDYNLNDLTIDESRKASDWADWTNPRARSVYFSKFIGSHSLEPVPNSPWGMAQIIPAPSASPLPGAMLERRCSIRRHYAVPN